MGTPEAAACSREDLSLVPCRNDVPSCKAVDRGQCVTDGYCCNEKGKRRDQGTTVPTVTYSNFLHEKILNHNPLLVSR